MVHIDIVLEMDRDDDKRRPAVEKAMRDGRLIHHTKGFTVGGLSAGMESGRPSVMMIFDGLPKGQVLMVETSLRVLEAAVRALRARHPEPMEPGDT